MEAKNRIELVVLDWAGTTVDYGSSAPVEVFKEIFSEAGITLTREEINGPMGMDKKSHIRFILSLESVRHQWENVYKKSWDESSVLELYNRFEERLKEIVADYSTPIHGTVETVNALRKTGIKIASTTGYTSQMMEAVTAAAAAQGYAPDCVVTPDMTGAGRPAPFMLYECMRRMKVYPAEAVVKVGDTITDILEGKNAGAWSVGILTGSNLLGLTQEEYAKMDKEELFWRKEKAREKYIAAGADLVIDNISGLMDAVQKINEDMMK